MKRIVIVGATSGIGRATAHCFLQAGWMIGVAGRREEALEAMRRSAPGRVFVQRIDVTDEEAPQHLLRLIEQMGGMDVFLLSSGVGWQNPGLLPAIELQTAATNVSGFVRMVDAAYHYFARQGKGHIAVISSVAGTRGLGAAPAYSATKRFQNTYIDALDQLARLNGLSLAFTDIRPGFVATPLLKGDTYPLTMRVEKVAMHIFRGIGRKKRVVVIDARYRVLVFFWRLVPRWLWVRLPVRSRS